MSVIKKSECQKLIDKYLKWLKEGIEVLELNGCCEITTPFLDRHNDEIAIYAEKLENTILLTDDGYTIQDLRASGFEFTTDKRKGHLESILHGYGVKREGDEICVTVSSPNDFPQKKHNIIQAMLAVSDMFVMGEAHVLFLFKEDVMQFLDEREIPHVKDIKLSGKSGLDHKFDFTIPKMKTKHERVLRAINKLERDDASLMAFAVGDIKLTRSEPLEALAFLNDVVNKPNDDYVATLQAYEIKPLLWSQRDSDSVLKYLNGK